MTETHTIIPSHFSHVFSGASSDARGAAAGAADAEGISEARAAARAGAAVPQRRSRSHAQGTSALRQRGQLMMQYNLIVFLFQLTVFKLDSLFLYLNISLPLSPSPSLSCFKTSFVSEVNT